MAEIEFPVIASQTDLLKFLRQQNERINKLEKRVEAMAAKKQGKKRFFDFDDEDEDEKEGE
jgi:hypothetical protein